MNLLSFLKEHIPAVALILCLLVVQAFADLSIPKLTSDLVDIGIQQRGVEDVAVEEMRESTFKALCLIMPSSDEQVLHQSYTQTASGSYALNDTGYDRRNELNDMLAAPLVIVYYAESGAGMAMNFEALSKSLEPSLPSGDMPVEETASLAASIASTADDSQIALAPSATETSSVPSSSLASSSTDNLSASSSTLLASDADGSFPSAGLSQYDPLGNVQTLYDAGLITKDQIVEGVSILCSQLEEAGRDLLNQQALQAALAEYEALGYDMNEFQMKSVLQIGGRMLAMAILCMAMSVFVCLIAARTAAKIGKTLRERLFSQVLHFSEREIGGFSAASLITRGTNDVQQIQMMTTWLLRMVLYAPILAIGGIIMIVQTNAQMGWIIACAIAAIFIVVGILFKLTIPKFRIMQSLIDKVNLISRETLTGLPVIRAFNRESLEEERFDQASLDLMRTQLYTNRAMAFMIPSMLMIMNVLSVAIVWFGGFYIDQGTLQTGDLIAFITYSMVIVLGFLMIGMIAIFYPRANVAAGRLIEVLKCQSSIVDPEKPRDGELTDREISLGACISFDNVSFAFDKEAQNVLSHISFTVPAGTTCALVGSTGSGKTTVMRLIERFYDVDKGAILLDGIDIRQLSQHALRSQIGYIPQKPFLFSGTIADTIAYADPFLNEDQMKQVAQIAQAKEFIEDSEEGYQTELSEGGTNVSGGQRQRLAIARALASHARVYLFDDSFSALDYKTDAALRAEIKNKLKGSTLIIVAQRISTVLNADHIVVLEEGQIVAQGTHDTLMETCPEYREIAYSQLSEEELKGGGRHA